MKWIIWLLFVAILGIGIKRGSATVNVTDIKECLRKEGTTLVIYDYVNSVATDSFTTKSCMVYVKKNQSSEDMEKGWPQISSDGQLTISRWFVKKKVVLKVIRGEKCNKTLHNLTEPGEGCKVRSLEMGTICKSSYDAMRCQNRSEFSSDQSQEDNYIINLNVTDNCLNCNNPVKTPAESYNAEDVGIQSLPEGEEVSSSQAAEIMENMSNILSVINGSSAAVSLGAGVQGVIVKETTKDVDEISFAYSTPVSAINIIDKKELEKFSRSVTVSKEAFDEAVKMNVSVPFAAIFRFLNMSKDAKNSTILANEIIAVEMGITISNLTDKIGINFWNMDYKGYPSCHSWNGEDLKPGQNGGGQSHHTLSFKTTLQKPLLNTFWDPGSQPNWTDHGCETIQNGTNITCRCSHLTFFAVLLAPLNETISSTDLNNLTTITQVGCGLSMFFLAIVLFMHCLLTKGEASTSTKLLIHLVVAMFLLNLTFLINNFVAAMKNSVGCKIMAAVMHYFMLATFTWFAVQAFHLCLQLYMRDKVVINRYLLKVCITSWVLPSIFVIVLLSTGKYGKQFINTDDSDGQAAMCWITDNDTHYIVNIGYYVVVFIFTFTTFIITMSWLFCLKRTNIGNSQDNASGKNIVTIMGLCCLLGITWGFAFFAYGPLRIPSYYIFTILNSFQGFFLFIYYYKNTRAKDIKGGNKSTTDSSSSGSTLKTSLDILDNPYVTKK